MSPSQYNKAHKSKYKHSNNDKEPYKTQYF